MGIFDQKDCIDLIFQPCLRLTWWTRFSTAKRWDIEAESLDRKRKKHQVDPENFPDPAKKEEHKGNTS